MRRISLTAGAAALVIALAGLQLGAQQPAPQGPRPFSVGNRLGLPINPAPELK